MVISGAKDGLLAISSPSTGLTVRVLNDHKGAPITCLHVSSVKVRPTVFSSDVIQVVIYHLLRL